MYTHSRLIWNQSYEKHQVSLQLMNHLLQKQAPKNELVKKAITQDEVTGLRNIRIYF